MLIIPKKLDHTGKRKYRVVIDFRLLNEKTVGDAYPLPNITEILDQLGKARYFTVFDLASGFHQIELDPDDRSKTAFSFLNGHYEYIRMPMGLKNSPATFQRLMDQVLLGLQGVEAFIYLDDIVVYAEDLKEHGKKVRRLLNRLKEANLSLQPDKCEFLFKEITYLGHIISSDGVKPDPKKIEAVKNFPRPKNPKNIKQFLGLAGYYRRFIKNFATRAKPLTNLLKKEVTFKWGSEEEESFKDLRQALCESPILQYPDYEQPFTITTDASGYAVGALLSQKKDGIDLPIAFFSHVLNSAECNYSTTEKECLAVLYAVHQFRPYVYGKQFVLVSDHEPLRWIDSVKDPGQRLIRWRLKLRDYEYTFKYKPGKLNTNADALSRNPVTKESLNEDLNITYTFKPQDSDKNTPNLKIHELKGPESETAEDSSDEEIEKETARLLPIQTRQSKKTEEAKTKTLPKSFGRPKTTPSIIPQKPKDSSSKPSASGTQITTTRTRVNLRQPTPLTKTTHTLDESTIGKNLLRRRMEERRNQNRPNYQESSTESDDESRNESDATVSDCKEFMSCRQNYYGLYLF